MREFHSYTRFVSNLKPMYYIIIESGLFCCYLFLNIDIHHCFCCSSIDAESQFLRELRFHVYFNEILL